MGATAQAVYQRIPPSFIQCLDCINGRLNSYLADIDQQAQERLDTIIEQMARSQGITEALKAADQMTWVGKMNNIQASAMEIVNSELIYA